MFRTTLRTIVLSAWLLFLLASSQSSLSIHQYSAQTLETTILPETTHLSNVPLPAQSNISATLGRDDRTYHAQPIAEGYHAINPEQGFAVDWTTTDMSIQTGQAHWQLHPISWGYGDSQQALSNVAPQAEANHIEYTRGNVKEWYINGPFGIEQGFTLMQPPSTNTSGMPLILALALNGDVHAETAGDGLSLVTPDGKASLRYGGLLAYDATGRSLHALIETHGNQVLLQVADAGAQYPVTIDPFIQQAKLTASDGNSTDKFGYALAISGDGNTIVVGAYNIGAGAAYVFEKPGSGWTTMTQTAKLTATGGSSGDQFGWSVGISNDGSTVVVSASLANSVGASYVFSRSGAHWSTMTQTATLTPSDGAAFMGFGSSVAISSDGNAVVVGASDAKIGANNVQGAAYVFAKLGVAWANSTETIKLLASDGTAQDFFGDSVTINGSTVVVGANRPSGIGSAYVFVKSGVSWTTLTQVAKLTASDGATANFFGASVALSADSNTLAVGAVYTGGNGADYVFVKPGGGWTTKTQDAKLTASDSTGGDELGTSVAVNSDGSTIVSGAVYARNNYGSAYVFSRPGSVWTNTTQSAELFAASASDIGNAVTISGNTVVFGANTSAQGAAFVFTNVPGYKLYLPLVVK